MEILSPKHYARITRLIKHDGGFDVSCLQQGPPHLLVWHRWLSDHLKSDTRMYPLNDFQSNIHRASELESFTWSLTREGWRPVYMAVYGTSLVFTKLKTFPIIISVDRKKQLVKCQTLKKRLHSCTANCNYKWTEMVLKSIPFLRRTSLHDVCKLWEMTPNCEVHQHLFIIFFMIENRKKNWGSYLLQ